MIKSFFSFLFLIYSFSAISQSNNTEKIQARKLSYNDFVSNYSINDTSAVIIDIFFDKKSNAAYGQMSFLPITMGLAILPPTRVIGIGTTFISLPLFINGSYMLIKYRKKKLFKVLVKYKKTKVLPKWIRKKANKLLQYYETILPEY